MRDEQGPHRLVEAREWRVMLWWRQGGQCAACWGPLGPLEGQWHAHHRQRRKVLGNCGCNGVALHSGCHVASGLDPGPAVHAEPEWAQRRGLIVPAWHGSPAAVPIVVHWPWMGEGYLDHDGSVVSPTTPRTAVLRAEADRP